MSSPLLLKAVNCQYIIEVFIRNYQKKLQYLG